MSDHEHETPVAEPQPVKRIDGESPEPVELVDPPPEPVQEPPPEDVTAPAEPPEGDVEVQEVKAEGADVEDVDGIEDVERLLEQLEPEDEESGGALASYMKDEETAQFGKWFRWSKLGPFARLRIARRHNDQETRQWDAVVRRHGDPNTGDVNLEKRQKFTPVIMSKTVFTGMERVLMVSPKRAEQAEWAASGQAKIVRVVKKRRYTFRFALHVVRAEEITADEFGALHPSIQYLYEADGDGYRLEHGQVGWTYLVDSVEARLTLLRLFKPELQNEIHRVANLASNFKDPDDDTVAGN